MKQLNATLKIFIIVFATISFSISVEAQDSKILGGIGLNYTSNISSMGISAKGVYLIDDVWEASAAFTYLFENNYTNWSMLDLDGHYVFSSDESKAFYGLAGLNFTFWKVQLPTQYESFFGNSGISGTEVGLNLGVGGRYTLSDKLNLVGEVKYTLGGFGFLTIGAGVLYSF